MSACVVIALIACITASLLALRPVHVDLPAGAVPTRVGSIDLIPSDLYPEPDHLGTYPLMREFFGRQTTLTAALSQPSVHIAYTTAQGQADSAEFVPRARQLSDLPFAFWFQQAVGVLALLTSGWVLALRKADWGAGMFALTGLTLAIAAMSAAIYSTRQIALDGDLFHILSSVNHTGSITFGIALVNLFLMYPRPLIRPIWLLVPTVFFSFGLLLELMYVGKEMWLAPIIAVQLLLSILFGGIQWWRARGDQVERAGLRWFFLFSLIGCSLFVGLSIMPPMLGLADQGYVPQAYAFGFFNLMHIGLAFAVTRWRVFELDRYAYYIWLWLGGVFLIFATDLVLLLWLRDQPWASLSIALVLCGFLYFPLRQVILVRLFNRKPPQVSELMPYVLDTALAPTSALQSARWDQLLHDTFAPAAEFEIPDVTPLTAQIRENGAALALPGPKGLPARLLRYPAQGRRLFNTGDAELAETLLNMHKVASESHLAYERGVSMERDRISRDVHDNIGAQLLSALHAAEGSRKDALLRDTLTDLRQIISDGFRSDFRLADVFADLRAEMGDRLEVHDITFDWQADAAEEFGEQRVPFLLVNTLRSVLREAASNIIKHAGAGQVVVHLTQSGDMIEIRITDNGKGFDPNAVTRGEGLNNMAERVTSQGGTIRFAQTDGLMVVDLRLPLGSSSAMSEAAQ